MLLVGLAVVAARLVYVQVVKGPEYAEAASSQRTRDITISPERGFIYDREGEVLAESMEARTIYAVPDAIKDKPAAAAAIANAIGGDPARYEEKLSKDSGFVSV
ncbi:MAG: penicillin-binding protein 2, partial [Actinomycetota bacterium]